MLLKLEISVESVRLKLSRTIQKHCTLTDKVPSPTVVLVNISKISVYVYCNGTITKRDVGIQVPTIGVRGYKQANGASYNNPCKMVFSCRHQPKLMFTFIQIQTYLLTCGYT